MDKVRTVLTHCGAPELFWTDCLLSVVHVHNRTTHKSLPPDITPYHRWTGKAPDVAHLRPFGCICYAHVPKTTARGKLDPRAIIGMMLGYNASGSGYTVWDINSNKRRVIETRDCKFREGQYYKQLTAASGRGGGIHALDRISSTSSSSTTTIPQPATQSDDDDETDEPAAQPTHGRQQRSQAVDLTEADETVPTARADSRRPLNRELALLRDFNVSGDRDGAPSTLGSTLAARQTPLHPSDSATELSMAMAEVQVEEPRTFRQAMASPQAEEWREGCTKEKCSS